jgi:SNF2 family DNA or RNA helicase
MIQWIRPQALACTEAEFVTRFSKPIMAGLPSDASEEEKRLSSLMSKQLNKILSPYVHRKDEHVLRELLPSLTQVVIHVRQTKLQTNLYKALKRHEDLNGITNYLERFANSRPIHNHPACVLMKSKQEDSSEDPSWRSPWWQKTVDKIGEDNLRKVKHGAKMIVLLHILTHSYQIRDKVVVFANCLKSLDFMEEMLRLPRWADRVRSLKRSFPYTKLGGWTNGVDYFRLDGRTDAGTRGTLIEKFNKDANVKLFLISRAGNVGITLYVGANFCRCHPIVCLSYRADLALPQCAGRQQIVLSYLIVISTPLS